MVPTALEPHNISIHSDMMSTYVRKNNTVSARYWSWARLRRTTGVLLDPVILVLVGTSKAIPLCQGKER